MKIKNLFLVGLLGLSFSTYANERAREYRNYVLKIPQSSQFKIVLPNDTEWNFSYRMQWGQALRELPGVGVYRSSTDPNQVSYTYVDRHLLAAGSRIQTGKTTLPLTCVFVRGNDRRNWPYEDLPLHSMTVYIVAGDSTCAGPNSNFEDDVWENYVYFRITNFETFRPENVTLKFKGNKFRGEIKE